MPTEATLPSARKLGSYLGCSSDSIAQALTHQSSLSGDRQRPRLGQILVESQTITRTNLLSALKAQRADRLRECSLFSELSDKELSILSVKFQEVSLNADEKLIAEDERDPFLYVLVAGGLDVFRSNEDGEEVPLGLVSSGEPVGEMAYFANGARSASVRARGRCELLRIPYAELPDCFDAAPNFAKAFLRAVSDRLRRANVRYTEAYVENIQRRKTHEKTLAWISELLDLSEVSALGIGIDGLIDRLVRNASKLLDADRASLFLFDPLNQVLWSKVAQGSEHKEIRIPVDSGVVGWVARHAEIVNIPDAYQDDRFDQATDDRTGYRTRTILCGPVWGLNNEVLGVLQLINKRSGLFTPSDEKLFRAFSHQAGVAVENFNLYRRLLLSHEKMAIMLDIATSLGQTLDLHALIRFIAEKVTHVLECDRCSVFVLDKETEELCSLEAHGDELKEIRFPGSQGLAGYTVTTGQVLNVPDAYDDLRFNPDIDRQSGYRTRNVLCVPLKNRTGEIVGVVQAINKIDGAFEKRDVELLRATSSQIGIALENARLHADTLSLKNYLESVQQSISNGILTLDRDYRLVTANKAGLTLLGEKDGPELAPRDIREVLGPVNTHLFGLLERVYRTRTSVIEYDVDLFYGKDKPHAVNVNVLPLLDGENVFQGLVIVLEDITREKRVKSTLTRYLSQDIVERVLTEPHQEALGGVRSTATVLFNDIRAFTSIAEGLTAEETMGLLNEYLTLMVDEVLNERGVLDKFLGDGLMAVFGVPYPKPDDAVRAVRAALGMRDALRRYNEGRLRAGSKPLRIGIGINTGEVVSGNIGSSKRMDYTVIGDGVNVSSRLESLNKQYGTDILISSTTRSELQDEFAVRVIDKVTVKGKSWPVIIYELLGDSNYRLTDVEECFVRGFRRYERGEFTEALRLFKEGADTDEPCRIFASRCARALKRPPKNWDGTWQAPVK